MYELSHGNTYPGVFTPFGMLGWTAQMTEGNGWPYQYFRETLIGFMATHQPSAWMSNYGRFSLMPLTGALQVQPGERASHFSHDNEHAAPYLYSVLLDAYQVKVEMAPSARRRRFPIYVPENPRMPMFCWTRATAAARWKSIPRTIVLPERIAREPASRRISRNTSLRFSTIPSRGTACGRFPKTRKAGRCRASR